MSLDTLTSWLYGRTAGGMKWGLDTTRALLAGGGDPHRRFRVVHVGGTNGKGSVATLCAAALRARGAGSVGLYTSPHLVSFRERVRIDGVPVSEERLLDAARRLEPFIEESGASFFEATTAIAFLCFAEAGVEVAVVEVGLGGRLDATNVVEPEVTVVTNVALDHTLELGGTLAEVAAEKAGIFKPGVPVITGEGDISVLRMLRERADAVGAPFAALEERMRVEAVEVGLGGTTVRFDSAAWGVREIRVPLVGEHQARNAAVAMEALALLPGDQRPTWEAVARGFAGARWPGRFQVDQIRGTTWILDVAHNPAGVAALVRALAQVDAPRPVVLVVAILADKDWREMLAPLVAAADAVVLTTAPSAPAARRWDPVAAGEWLRGGAAIPVRVVPDLDAALSRAATLAPHGTVVVTGSVHTVGDSMERLGIPVG